MAEETGIKPPLSAGSNHPPAAEAKATPKPAVVAKGDTVHLVHAKRGRVPAEVTKVNKDGTLDLETIDPDPLNFHPQTKKPHPLVITNSPRATSAANFDGWVPADEAF